jgi:hypothetical protein
VRGRPCSRFSIAFSIALGQDAAAHLPIVGAGRIPRKAVVALIPLGELLRFLTRPQLPEELRVLLLIAQQALRVILVEPLLHRRELLALPAGWDFIHKSVSDAGTHVLRIGLRREGAIEGALREGRRGRRIGRPADGLGKIAGPRHQIAAGPFLLLLLAKPTGAPQLLLHPSDCPAIEAERIDRPALLLAPRRGDRLFVQQRLPAHLPHPAQRGRLKVRRLVRLRIERPRKQQLAGTRQGDARRVHLIADLRQKGTRYRVRRDALGRNVRPGEPLLDRPRGRPGRKASAIKGRLLVRELTGQRISDAVGAANEHVCILSRNVSPELERVGVHGVRAAQDGLPADDRAGGPRAEFAPGGDVARHNPIALHERGVGDAPAVVPAASDARIGVEKATILADAVLRVRLIRQQWNGGDGTEQDRFDAGAELHGSPLHSPGATAGAARTTEPDHAL